MNLFYDNIEEYLKYNFFIKKSILNNYENQISINSCYSFIRKMHSHLRLYYKFT